MNIVAIDFKKKNNNNNQDLQIKYILRYISKTRY